MELQNDQLQQHRDLLTEKKWSIEKQTKNVELFFYFYREILVSTQELANTIRHIQKVSSTHEDAQVSEIIKQFDHDKDGFIDADEILKVNFFFSMFFIDRFLF